MLTSSIRFCLADLAVYGEGKTTDPQVERYVQILTRQSKLFLSILFGGMTCLPLRAASDKVLLPKSAFETENQRVSPPGSAKPTFSRLQPRQRKTWRVFMTVRGTTMAGTFQRWASSIQFGTTHSITSGGD